MKVSAGIAVFLVAALGASAADAPNVISVSGAFRPYARSGQWSQLSVRLENPTGQAVQVKFVLFARDASSGRVHYTRTVDLPSHTRRVICLGHHIGAMKSKPSPAKKIPQNEQAFRLEDAATDKILDSNYALIRPLEPEEYCLAYVDPEDLPGQTHSYLAKMKMPPESLFDKIALASSIQRTLPGRWYGYSPLNMLVVSSFEQSGLMDAQIDAILEWVSRGGVLLIASHPSADQTLAGRLAEAAGVVVAGDHQEYRLEATSTEGKERFEADLATPMIMSHLCPLPGTSVLWKANGMPLLTSRRFGLGTVFTLSVPVGALATDRSESLWRRITRQTKRSVSISSDAFGQEAEGKLAQIAGCRSPDRRIPVLVVVVLAVLFGLTGLFLRFIRRGELTWLVMVPLSLLGAVGMLVWATTLSDEPRLSFLAMASVRPDGTARVQQLSTYYTPETEEITLSPGSPLGIIRPVSSASISVMELVEISSGRAMALENVRVIANSSRTAYADSPIVLPGELITELSLGPKGLAGKITNDTGADIFDAIIIAGGRAYSIGDLPSGRATDIVANDPPLPKDTYTEKDVRDKVDRLRSDLVAALVRQTPAGSYRLTKPEPILLGWSRRRLLNALDDALQEKVESRGLTLLTLPLTILKSPSGTKIVVPGGMMELRVGGHPPVWVAKEQRFNESTLSGEVVLNFAPMDGVVELDDARATLQITMEALNCRIQILAVTGKKDDAEKQTLIRTIDRPVGAYEIAAENLHHLEGGYKIIIKVDPIETDKSKEQERISTMWKIKSLNLTLEGVSK